MLHSEVIIVSVDRPYEHVYAFLVEPMNFNRWAANPGSVMEAIGGGEYLVDLPPGRMVIRFSPPNLHGVLDYKIYPRGATDGPVRPVRLIRNGSGADVQLTRFQPDGVSDEQFRSEIEWIRSDLQRLKTLLETL